MKTLLFHRLSNGSKKGKFPLMERKIENQYKSVEKLYANFILSSGCTGVTLVTPPVPLICIFNKNIEQCVILSDDLGYLTGVI